MALEVLSANTVRVGDEVFPLGELETALRSTGMRPPYRVELSREVEAGEFEEVWGIYEALNALHEVGTVASISPEAPSGQPEGRFTREVPAKSACVRVAGDGAVAVGQSFKSDAGPSSLDQLVEFAGELLQENPNRSFIVEAEESSSPELVERVQISLQESGVERIYLLVASPDSDFQVCQLAPQ